LSGGGGAEEGGCRAAPFDEVGGGSEDVFECVDGGESGCGGAEGEGEMGGGVECVEGLLRFELVEPGEEVGDGDGGFVGEGAEVVVEADEPTEHARRHEGTKARSG
jgi:hypothetical protein